MRCLNAFLLVLAAVSVAITASATDVIEGELSRAYDGDTIAVNVDGENLRLRLHAIDTPDQEQNLYVEAGDALRALLVDRRLRVVLVAKTHGRLAAVIVVDGTDINGELIRAGFAYAHRKYLGLSDFDSRYCALEHEARVANRGIWALPPEQRIAPWQLRQSYRSERTAFTDFSDETIADCEAAAGKPDTRAGTIETNPIPGLTPPDPDCRIKADITSSGKRRYYVPGMRAYPSIIITEKNGERWFCSESDAAKAGWDRA
jgi:endonuclease YncB( thermonuclease family)